MILNRGPGGIAFASGPKNAGSGLGWYAIPGAGAGWVGSNQRGSAAGPLMYWCGGEFGGGEPGRLRADSGLGERDRILLAAVSRMLAMFMSVV